MNRPLVVDTGPLVALAAIDRLDLLKPLADEVLVPAAVHQEILAGGAGTIGTEAYLRASWLQRTSLRQELDPLLASILDRGEASVIQLALERQVSRVVIDERKGRRVAREIYGLQVLGTGRVLVEARKANLLSDLRGAFSALRANGYWIADPIVDACLREVNEE